MWIFLGIVSFTAFFSYALWRRLVWAIGWADDKGHLRTKSNQIYKFEDTTQKNQRRFYFAVPCARGVSLRIHRESWWDRLAKKVGLSYEYQFNDPEFDNELYVVSNAPAFQAELAETKPLREVVRLLFRDKRLKRIECHGQHVVARYEEKVENGAVNIPKPNEVNQVVAGLYGLADSLEIAKARSASGWDAYQLRAAFLAAMSTALLAWGAIDFFSIPLLGFSQAVLDHADLLAFSVSCTILMLVGLMLLTVVLLRGSSYAHVILAEVVVSGGIGLALLGYGTVREVNVSFDQSAQRLVQADVTGKHTWRGRKSGTHYNIYLRGQDGLQRLPGSIEVSSDVYYKAQTGKPVTLMVRDGALGYRWVEGYSFN